ncbi:squalene/phytoene synthase family protein [Streptomyces sp. NBC_00212]|uniref:squalene/phytoene synthase family protein n=1 Tax=Streptomyces sp. NBC_00212 TaxID=2975684 RepID=UPI00324898A1
MPADAETFVVLEATSRSFVLPIMQLNGDLRDAVTAYYLSTRAIDQIEDHPVLPPVAKAELLRAVGRILQTRFDETSFASIFQPHHQHLEPVTLQLGRWMTRVPPASVAPHLWEAVSAMAGRMAYWVERDFRIATEADLDHYTYTVAGSVGLGLSNLWLWHAGVITDQNGAIALGRGLQAVHMLWSRDDDLARGVDFFPDGWTSADMRDYAQRSLTQANDYLGSTPPGPIWNFSHLLWDIIAATLNAATREEATLSRQQITALARRYGSVN